MKDVLTFLKITSEKQAEIDAEQDKLRQLYHSRARLNKSERVLARGIELERHHRQTNNRDGFAEALAMQGRFQEAAEVAKRKDLKKEYIERHTASMQDDGDCECDNFREENDVKIPNQFVEFDGFSEKHQAQMPFIRCLVCGNLNAKPLPGYLKEQRELRARSLNGETIRGDEIFRAR